MTGMEDCETSNGDEEDGASRCGGVLKTRQFVSTWGRRCTRAKSVGRSRDESALVDLRVEGKWKSEADGDGGLCGMWDLEPYSLYEKRWLGPAKREGLLSSG